MVSEKKILQIIKKLTPYSRQYLHDDAAIIENNYVLTTDSLVENTHFTLKDYKAEEIGYKALAVNLSDIASMGAKPLYGLVSLCLPKNIKAQWIKSFYKGLIYCAGKYRTKIIGGNLALSRNINICVTLIGKVSDNPGLRKNAKSGDVVFACGYFGESACGLIIMQNKKLKTRFKNLVKSHKLPEPQIREGQKIISKCNNPALIDSSDGLADALIQISEESNVKIVACEKLIPISEPVRKACKMHGKNPLSLALYGGEDYKLVGTTGKENIKKLKKIKNLHIIGTTHKGNGCYLKCKHGNTVKLNTEKAFKHF